VGRLALDRRSIAAFEYDRDYLPAGPSVHPLRPRPAPGVIFATQPRTFDGLHGIFADSLPDAWGYELMRRRAAQQNVDYAALTVLDRLSIVGSTGVGALVYKPDSSAPADATIDLDVLADGALAILDGDDTAAVEELAKLGGSSGGARPKVFVARDSAGRMLAGAASIPDGYDAWIVKFKSRRDVVDIGPLEAAYADMARAAGIDMALTTLIAAASGPGYFATKRFDRSAGNVRHHVLSVAAILETDWSLPSAIDYASLHTLVRRVTGSQIAVEQMFRRMSFNVLAHNRDDHTKQHAFIMSSDGEWQLAPAYDLTLSPGPGGEHYLTVNNKGTAITDDDMHAVAREAHIRPARAREIIGVVKAAIADFPKFAKVYGVRKSTTAAFRTAARSA
jgi:serine/threonine-protein kinase HipA